MFHRHKWEIVSQREQPSRIEILREAGVSRIRNGGWDDSWQKLATRDVIITRRCQRCGAEDVIRR